MNVPVCHKSTSIMRSMLNSKPISWAIWPLWQWLSLLVFIISLCTCLIRWYTKYFGYLGNAGPSLVSHAFRSYHEWEEKIDDWQQPILRDTWVFLVDIYFLLNIIYKKVILCLTITTFTPHISPCETLDIFQSFRKSICIRCFDFFVLFFIKKPLSNTSFEALSLMLPSFEKNQNRFLCLLVATVWAIDCKDTHCFKKCTLLRWVYWNV